MKSSRMTVPVLALMTVAGWGAFGYSVLTSVEIRKQLQGQVAILQDFQAQYLEQQEKSEETVKENASLREQLTETRAELQKIDTELKSARDQLASSSHTGFAQSVGNAPDLLRIKPRPTKQDVMAAQQALTQLRFGDLKADGVVGASTRKAIEEFQRTVGLPVTGELHAQTLLSLMRSSKVMAAQGARAEEPL